ncbi:hypothetical protein JCM10213_000312 [Rhodosporidiobolus nylandii]
MSSLLAGVRRLRLGAVLSLVGTLLAHCAWVLLNGSSVAWRLWSVVVGAFPPFLWTFLFKQAKHIPTEIRPPIHIDLLPKLNAALLSPWGVLVVSLSLFPLARLVYYWGNGDKQGEERGRGRAYAASILAFPLMLKITAELGKAEVTDFLDLLAFSTYGALHFASPIVAGWWTWGFGTQGAACTFGWTLGAQNLAGLATHLVFPNASPWFYDVYGIDAAQPDYTYPGNPAGLIRVDTILGTHIYAKAFGAGPVVFGAIPSLHAATAMCCCLYVIRYSKGYRGLVFAYVYGYIMLWSTQYFHHHFAIDLLVGCFYAAVSFLIFERVRLRRLDREHYANGLTNGYDRLFHSLRDGENFTAYGERQLARLSGNENDAEKIYDIGGGLASSGSSSSGGSVRLANLGGAGREGGYTAVPQRGGSVDIDESGDGRVVFELAGDSDDERDKSEPSSRLGSPRLGSPRLGAVKTMAVV